MDRQKYPVEKKALNEYLPEDIIEKIFLKLPAKSVGLCLCVCKSWNSLIKSPAFISSHLGCQSPSSALCLLRYLSNKATGTYSWKLSLHSDNNHGFSEYKLLAFPFEGYARYGATTTNVICINGLFFLINGCHGALLWNPTIQRYIQFTSFFSLYHTCGFGYDACTDDYKFVRFPYNSKIVSSTQVEIFSVKTYSWKIVTVTAPAIALQCKIYNWFTKTFVNGALHWLANCDGKHFVLSFDLEHEIFREITLPQCFFRSDPTPISLLVHEEYSSIAMFNNNYDCAGQDCYLWIMKQYGMADSWTKVLILRKWGLTNAIAFGSNCNDLLLELALDGAVVSCSIESGNTRHLDEVHCQELEHRVITCASPHRESLELLNIGQPVSQFHKKW